MSTAGFKDHFSAHAADYAEARPRYPDSLFRFLAHTSKRRELAWDCATGNGQAAVSLARHFRSVIATDASSTQIAAAMPAVGVSYRIARAEASSLDAASVDLVTVAQALHWFDLGGFFAEITRVSKPGGILAAWSYGTCTIDATCDALVHGLYDSLDDYWPPERRIVESGYADIELPGVPLDAPSFPMTIDWSADAMLAYLRSWSAAQRYLQASGIDPTDAIADELRGAWGGRSRTVTWPLTLKMSRIG